MGPASKTSSNTVPLYGEVDNIVKLKPKGSEGGNSEWEEKKLFGLNNDFNQHRCQCLLCFLYFIHFVYLLSL